MKFTAMFLTVIFWITGYGQTVFLESFDEADNSTTGVDNTASVVAWEALCPGSVATTDYYKVVGGKLEARDTNGPGATWETETIDISSCIGTTVSFTIEETGNMEECLDCGGTGTGCVDWVKLEYNLDGAGWVDIAGISCVATMTEAPGQMVQIGDIVGGTVDYTSPCIDVGTTLQIRISCMCWAGTEYWRIDNVEVACTDCVLDVELDDFRVEKTQEKRKISWATLNERDNDYFVLERSYDGITYEKVGEIDGAGNSSERIEYSFDDESFEFSQVTYYRLKQFDYNGNSSYSKIISISASEEIGVFYKDHQIFYNFPNVLKQPTVLNIYSLSGQLIRQVSVTESGSFEFDQIGLFIVVFPEFNYYQKLSLN